MFGNAEDKKRDLLALFVWAPFAVVVAAFFLNAQHGDGGGGKPSPDDNLFYAYKGAPKIVPKQSDKQPTPKELPKVEKPKDEVPKPEPKPEPPLPKQSLANPVQATKVEKEIRPVEAMESQDVQTALESYQQWERDGQIHIKIDIDDATPETIQAITEAYFMKLHGTTIFVRAPLWEGARFEGSVDDPLLQKIPSDKWPQPVRASCKRWFGDQAKPQIDIRFTPQARLEVYRRVGESDTKNPIPKGTIVWMKLKVDPQKLRWSFAIQSLERDANVARHEQPQRPVKENP